MIHKCITLRALWLLGFVFSIASVHGWAGVTATDVRGRVFASMGTEPDQVLVEGRVFAKDLHRIQALAWHGRDLWISNSPDLTVVRDTDDDGEADDYTLMARRLGDGEHGLHGIAWGADGKLYLATGDLSLMPAGELGRPMKFHKGEYAPFPFTPPAGLVHEDGILKCDPDGRSLEIISRGQGSPSELWFDDAFHLGKGIAPRPAPEAGADPKRERPYDQWTFDELAADLGAPTAAYSVAAQEELARRGESIKVGMIELLERQDLSQRQRTWALWTLGRAGKDDVEIEAYFPAQLKASKDANTRLQCERIIEFRAKEYGLAKPASVRVNFVPPAFDSLQFRTDSDQAYSLTRLDFVLSELELKQPNGTWVGQSDWFAYLSLRNGRDGFTLKGVPAGKYTAMRFFVGVRPEINKADVTKYPSNHPLNPTLNTLWWGWQGGFVFMAIEGGWRGTDGGMSGFSFHVARDQNLMRVELETALDLSQDMEVNVKIDPALIFKGVKLSDDSNSTHSRDEDALAAQLHLNIEKAFSVSSIKAKPLPTDAKAPQVVLDPRETLQPFTFASHFPRPTLPGDNPLTQETIALGKRLFEDKRLSINNSQACADCHDRAHAFSDPRRFSLGAEGQVGIRNAMPLFNLAWKQRFFWDGRSPTLRDQVLRPIQDPKEMHETLPGIEKKLGLSADRVSRALEQYLLTLVSDNAKIDRVMRGGETFTDQEQRGFMLFHTEYDPAHGQRGADCFHCHGGTLFQSVPFANNGLDAHPQDIGLEAVTKKPGDRAKFAVPSLRNVERTAPYMHDGRFATLAEVIDHYDHGLNHTETLDPNLAKHPPAGLGLSADDKAALVAFLRTLTDAAFVEK